MLNPKTNQRELAYVARVTAIHSIEGADRVEVARVGGWTCMVPKDAFQVNDLGIFFEVDSKVPATEPFAFMEKRKYHVKVQKFFKGTVLSDALLMSASDFGGYYDRANDYIMLKKDNSANIFQEGNFLTEFLGVTYYEAEDNARKSAGPDKYKRMATRNPKIFKNPIVRKLYKTNFGKKLLFFFFGNKKKDTGKDWPVGRFPGVSKTDQERCENMTWILQDKSPFVVTQKCDGSSGTYILERKGENKFEFYVCSRNVRMKNEEQECFYGSHNYYWEVAKKYDIEKKMRVWLNTMPDRDWVCWQGEICAPGIQKNPHNLSETHFYCFHWTDNVNGRKDIRDAANIWRAMDMEVVPIVSENYIMPDDFDEFKKSAEGYYNSEVCEGHSDCKREGFVYYKASDPTFSFKNVSKDYLLNH